MQLRIQTCSLLLCTAMSAVLARSSKADDNEFPTGWTAQAVRDEVRPKFSVEPKAGPDGSRVMVITATGSVGLQGWFQKTFPVTGGRHYRFQALRAVEGIDVPRRSVVVRILWQDAKGKPVLADAPAGREQEPGVIPQAEPEHPIDRGTDAGGWTEVSGTYRAPSRAAQAVVELHLQWTATGRVAWREVSLSGTTPPAPRNVRLATIHYRPTGKSALDNCREYAPLIAEAAKQKADLVVLGETVPYVGLSKKPHETAETIPGPSTDCFSESARDNQIHVVVSLYEREAEVVYNTAVLIGPDGKLIGKYRKVCLPQSEIEAGVTPGSDYPVFDTKFGKVGMMICYDGFYPEVARELSNRGAEVIAWPVWGCNPLLAQARACENHVYVVSSTYTDVKTQWMISAVFDHAGQSIAQAKDWGSVAVAEVDLSHPHFWRNNIGDFHSMLPRHRPAPVAEPQVKTPPKPVARPVGQTRDAMKTVAVLLFDGVELMDFAGPAEVFIIADHGRAFRVVTVAASTEPLKTMGGITVTPDYSFQTVPRADIIVVPGGRLSAVGQPGIDWLKRASGEAEITMSVCYGAFLLAEARLLKELEITTHHFGIEGLKQAAPGCTVVTGRRFIDSGRIITTAGVTAGIDGALRIVERVLGKESATWAAEEWMEHHPQKPSGK